MYYSLHIDYIDSVISQTLYYQKSQTFVVLRYYDIVHNICLLEFPVVLYLPSLDARTCGLSLAPTPPLSGIFRWGWVGLTPVTP